MESDVLDPAPGARLVCSNDVEVDVDNWVFDRLCAFLFQHAGELELVRCLARSADMRPAFSRNMKGWRAVGVMGRSRHDQGEATDESQKNCCRELHDVNLMWCW